LAHSFAIENELIIKKLNIMNSLLKNPRTSLILLSLAFFICTSKAADSFSVNLVPQKGKQSVYLFIESPGYQDLSMRLEDEKGYILWTEKQRTDEFAKSLNLKNLPLGGYKIIISNLHEEVTQSIHLTDHGTYVSHVEKKNYGFPEIKMEKTSFILDPALVSEQKTTSLSITDKWGIEVFDYQIKGGENPVRFDLSKLYPGQYSILLKSGARSYTTSIKL
jgi:hypothetical protein